MNISFSIIVEELNKFNISVTNNLDVNISNYKILDKDIDEDILYISDITSFAALAKKSKGNFIIIDPLDILNDINFDGDFNLIKINDNIEIDALINELNSIFHKYWMLENNILKLLADNEDISRILDFVKSNLNLCTSINDNSSSIIYSNANKNSKRIKSFTYVSNSKAIGSISLYDNALNTKNFQLAAFSFITKLIDNNLNEYFRTRLAASKNFATNIFESMVNDNEIKKEDLDNLNILGWDKNDNYLLIFLRDINKFEEIELQKLLDSAYETNSLFLKYDNKYIILLNTENIDENILKSEIKHMFEESENYLILISSTFSDISKISKVYKLLDDSSNKVKHGVFDLSTDIINLLIEGKLFNENFINQEIVKLHEYDLENDDELLETLYVYLACERSYVKTSELLNLHRNTIVYRINKVEGIINLDFDNIHTRIHCILSALSIDKNLLKYR